MKNTAGLQIGNYLYFKNTQDLAIIHLIHGEKHYDCRDEYGTFIPNGNYEPIPLTEQWLLDFGFIFGMEIQDFVKGKYKYVEIDVLKGNFSDIGVFYYSIKTQIKYVHQLQNLYFALTNQQLTIKK